MSEEGGLKIIWSIGISSLRISEIKCQKMLISKNAISYHFGLFVMSKDISISIVKGSRIKVSSLHVQNF